jgi:hypothetical protein
LKIKKLGLQGFLLGEREKEYWEKDGNPYLRKKKECESLSLFKKKKRLNRRKKRIYKYLIYFFH